MNSFEFPFEKEKAQVTEQEMKLKVDQYTHKSWLCFANDYNLDDKTKSLLTHQSRALINCSAVLTIQKKADREKVIELKMEKKG
ncbi:36829_t:CDS:2 [Gigaspora margarita]|uniref:36829_t:CDS:1 n=1 Tax=Gigaspora margarita TaxID=4874 RepID=A0ABM8W715_GIGMA|nr:36829_t:CDS:2 [Gigaspora margarita]